MSGSLILVLGGARSGKSTYAQNRAWEIGGESVLYVATAEALDGEMQARIDIHRAERPAGWQTLELPSLTESGLAEAAHTAKVVVVDCLTMLVSNTVIGAGENASQEQIQESVDREIQTLWAAVRGSDVPWLVVSNEVGLGIVPANDLARTYRDTLGRANQRLAAKADEVLFMVAGLPWRIK